MIGKITRPEQQLTPKMPKASPALSELALDVYRSSADLGGRLHPITRRSLADFLRLTNSYYSNLIEGHYTHPVDIERAIKGELSSEPAKRSRQIEARVHVEVQEIIEGKIRDREVELSSLDFICLIHRLFYERLPDDLRIVRNDETGETRQVEPGHYRDTTVKIGRHIPPHPDQLEALMDRFAAIYAPAAFQGTNRVLAAAAAHHRLAWIHPFLDGNGRVARLFTDYYLIASGVDGYGLWTICRGFARHRDRYVQHLSDADAPRQGDTDGRGQLTQRGLDRFCRFFLETALDQIEFMAKLLDIDGVLDRLKGYIDLRRHKMIPDIEPIKPEAFYLLKEALLSGEFARGEAARITGLAERTARQILRQLTEEGLLVSDTPKGPVRLTFPVAAVEYWLPKLVPG
mgnify:CR=1 FL=1